MSCSNGRQLPWLVAVTLGLLLVIACGIPAYALPLAPASRGAADPPQRTADQPAVAASGTGELACVQPPPGGLAWWSLDETAGNIAADRFGNHPAAWANAPVPSPGEVRGAYRFNGTSYVAAQNSPAWHFGGSDFSIELWASFASAPAGSVGEPAAILIANDEGPFNRNKWFFAVGGGMLYFHINGPQLGPQFFPLVSFSPVVGQWYHLALVRAGSLYTIYIDGVASGTATNPSVIADPDAPLTLAEGEGIGFLNGLLDEVAIYGRALQPEEVAAIFRAGPSGKCISLQVSPNTGGDTGKTSVTLTGTRFQPGATVSLVRAGEPSIVGSPVAGGSSGTSLATTFDLTGRPRGVW
ncbi:MAG TPA: LamG domain-containing protein, partial [Thermoanaerobaculia bacterium]